MQSAESLSFPDATFDTVICVDVIEHVVDAVSAARELHRVVAPGGCLITTTPNVCSVRRRLLALSGRFPWTSDGLCTEEGRLLDGGHFHYFTYGILKSIYGNVGLARCERFGIGRLGRLHQLYPPLLSSTVVLRCWRRQRTLLARELCLSDGGALAANEQRGRTMDARVNKVAALANAAMYDAERTSGYIDGAPHSKHAVRRKLYGKLIVSSYDVARKYVPVPQVLDLGAGEGSVTLPFLELGGGGHSSGHFGDPVGKPTGKMREIPG